MIFVKVIVATSSLRRSLCPAAARILWNEMALPLRLPGGHSGRLEGGGRRRSLIRPDFKGGAPWHQEKHNRNKMK